MVSGKAFLAYYDIPFDVARRWPAERHDRKTLVIDLKQPGTDVSGHSSRAHTGGGWRLPGGCTLAPLCEGESISFPGRAGGRREWLRLPFLMLKLPQCQAEACRALFSVRQMFHSKA